MDVTLAFHLTAILYISLNNVFQVQQNVSLKIKNVSKPS